MPQKRSKNVPSKKDTRTQCGFTIIEIMVALLITTLVIVGYVGTNIYAQKNSEEMHERTLAIQDANWAIEEMRNVSRTGTFPGNVIANFPDDATIPGFSSLNSEVVVASYENTSANPLNVTITVTWLSYGGRQQSTTLRTYITQR